MRWERDAVRATVHLERSPHIHTAGCADDAEGLRDLYGDDRATADVDDSRACLHQGDRAGGDQSVDSARVGMVAVPRCGSGDAPVILHPDQQSATLAVGQAYDGLDQL